MREVYFHNNGADEDVGNFLISLKENQQRVLEDLYVIAKAGPEALGCRDVGDAIWQYAQPLPFGRYAILLFTLLPKSDVYIVLHGFRAGRESVTRSDIRHARKVLEAYR